MLATVSYVGTLFRSAGEPKENPWENPRDPPGAGNAPCALRGRAGPTAPRTTATAPRVGARIWALSSALATGHITLRRHWHSPRLCMPGGRARGLGRGWCAAPCQSNEERVRDIFPLWQFTLTSSAGREPSGKRTPSRQRKLQRAPRYAWPAICAQWPWPSFG